jgi:hypothetical protein
MAKTLKKYGNQWSFDYDFPSRLFNCRAWGKMFSKLMNVYVSFAIILLGAAALCYGGELIEPTRTLQDAGERWGKLIVFSEPPEVDVFLDGSKVGQTPVWLERVKEGTHKLQIKDLEKEIYVKEGRTLKVGLFKGRFITRLEEEKKVGKQAAADKKEPATKVEAAESPEKQKDLSRWEKFVNGTLKHF